MNNAYIPLIKFISDEIYEKFFVCAKIFSLSDFTEYFRKEENVKL